MQNRQPLVSVIMNCYNGDKYLREAIDSILVQTYQNWEIIFWDNQSTDKSAEIVKSYDDKRIKYFYASSHTSLGEGRNKALEKTQGEFISFLDCDDFYLPQKIEKTIVKFEDDSVGLVYTNGCIFFDEKNIKKSFYKKQQKIGYLFEDWLCSYQIMIPSVMFRKKVLMDLEYYFDTRFSMIEEFDFFIRMARECKVGYCHDQLCIWRAHSSSLTWTKKDLFEKENKLFLESILNKYPGLRNSFPIKRFEAKIAYHEFVNRWNTDKKLKRTILRPYLFIDKRLIFVYVLSFLGKNNFNKLLKLIGKNV